MIYIRDNKKLGLKYCAKIEDAPLSDLLIQFIINNEKKLMSFYDSIWQYCPDTGISTGSYIVFYRGGLIDHCTHVIGPVSQYIYERYYNAAFAIVPSA